MDEPGFGAFSDLEPDFIALAWVQVLAHVHERDSRVHLHARRQLPPGDDARPRPSPDGRYLAWLAGLVTGDFGTSWTYRVPVGTLILQRLELSTVVMDDANCGFEPQFQRPACNGKGILGILDASSKNGVDIDIEFGILGKPLKFFIKDFQAFCRDSIRLHVVNADLQMLKTGTV